MPPPAWTIELLPHSAQDFMNHMAMYVGQSEVATAEAKRQLFVIETQQMQDRCMQIVHGADIFHGVDSQFVRRPINGTAFHATTAPATPRIPRDGGRDRRDLQNGAFGRILRPRQSAFPRTNHAA